MESIVLNNRKEESLNTSIEIMKKNPEVKEDSEVITIRLNIDERKQLNQIKALISEKKDSTVIKDALDVYQNVLLHILGTRVASRISNVRRGKNDL